MCFTLFTTVPVLKKYKGSVHTAFMNINAKTLFEHIIRNEKIMWKSQLLSLFLGLLFVNGRYACFLILVSTKCYFRILINNLSTNLQ